MFNKLKLKLYNYMHRWYINSLFENQKLIIELNTILKYHPDLASLSYKEGAKNIKIYIGFETILESPSQERHLFVRLNDIIVFELSPKNKILILRDGKWRKAIEGMSLIALYNSVKNEKVKETQTPHLGAFDDITEEIICSI